MACEMCKLIHAASAQRPEVDVEVHLCGECGAVYVPNADGSLRQATIAEIAFHERTDANFKENRATLAHIRRVKAARSN